MKVGWNNEKEYKTEIGKDLDGRRRRRDVQNYWKFAILFVSQICADCIYIFYLYYLVLNSVTLTYNYIFLHTHIKIMNLRI